MGDFENCNLYFEKSLALNPSFTINDRLISMSKKYKKNDDVKAFVKQKINRAEWFLHAINQRNKTITRVMKSIIKNQNLYFGFYLFVFCIYYFIF